MINISVIIPTYNRVQLLRKAIESVLNQSYKSIEIIVVSDASNDDTTNYMKLLCESNDNITFIQNEEQRGANYSRNLGVRLAKYDYVAFLDDDDYWYSFKLEEQLKLFENDKNIGLVCTAIESTQPEKKRAKKFIPSAAYDSSKLILIDNVIGSTTTVMIKKDIFNRSGQFDESLPAKQDYDLWIRVAQLTKIGVVNTPCVFYNAFHTEHQISSNTQKYITATDIILKKYESLYQRLTKKEFNISKMNLYLQIAKKGLKNNNRKISISYSINSFKCKFNTLSIIIFILSFFPHLIITRLIKK